MFPRYNLPSKIFNPLYLVNKILTSTCLSYLMMDLYKILVTLPVFSSFTSTFQFQFLGPDLPLAWNWVAAACGTSPVLVEPLLPAEPAEPSSFTSGSCWVTVSTSGSVSPCSASKLQPQHELLLLPPVELGWVPMLSWRLQTPSYTHQADCPDSSNEG
jgi:hypothetical protein